MHGSSSRCSIPSRAQHPPSSCRSYIPRPARQYIYTPDSMYMHAQPRDPAMTPTEKAVGVDRTVDFEVFDASKF